MERDPARIDVREPLTRFGLDSLAAAGLSGELEVWLERELPENLLAVYPTIHALAKYLADGAQLPATASPQMVSGDAASELREWTRAQLVTQQILSILVSVLYRVSIDGLENIPHEGSFILAANHLHILDAPIVFSFMPRRTVTLVSDHMRRVPLVNWFLRYMGSAIYVTRGEGDQRALSKALSALGEGCGMALAPEGKISKTGGLLTGHSGIAHMATLSGAPVIPMVIYGQERIRPWRPRVHIQIGSPLRFPAGKATARQLDAYRDEVMIELARMLPEKYRGVYRDRIDG